MTGEPNAPRDPSEEELRAALEEQMKRITVKDVLLQTVITLVNVSARRLGLAGDEDRTDLAEAQRGIDGVRALLPLLPAEEQAAIREPLSQLQMRYAQLASGSGEKPPAPAPESGPGPEAPEPKTPPAAGEDDERAKARAKIWTPPGT